MLHDLSLHRISSKTQSYDVLQKETNCPYGLSAQCGDQPCLQSVFDLLSVFAVGNRI